MPTKTKKSSKNLTAHVRRHAKKLLKKTAKLHRATRRQLTKRQPKKAGSRHLLRASIIVIATISTSSLAYAIAVAKPVVTVSVQGIGGAGIQLGTPPTPTPKPKAPGSPDQTGRASWYAWGLPEPDAITCASTTFGRGSYLQVKDLNNGRTVVCHVNDYGPEAWTGRVIDLSRGSFLQVDDLSAGVIPVEIRVVSGPSGFKLPISVSISRAVGYDLCRQGHNNRFCEDHRQSK
jgi:rare lipoprotein A